MISLLIIYIVINIIWCYFYCKYWDKDPMGNQWKELVDTSTKVEVLLIVVTVCFGCIPSSIAHYYTDVKGRGK